jgi:hypothetical protein
MLIQKEYKGKDVVHNDNDGVVNIDRRHSKEFKERKKVVINMVFFNIINKIYRVIMYLIPSWFNMSMMIMYSEINRMLHNL